MRTIAIVNQKGGCGKTTTTVNLAGCLAADGARVLVVDLDPQAHATLALGVDPDDLDENLYEVLIDPDTPGRLEEVTLQISDGLDLAPSGIVLSALEQRLAGERNDTRTQRLARVLARMPAIYDYVLIDCPPNVGILTFNALRAANEVLVPLETSSFAIDGLEKLLETIGLLSDRIGHELGIRILLTVYDGRTRYARQTLGEIRQLYRDMCFDTVIRQNVKLREAARLGLPIVRYAPAANGAADYAALAVEVAASGSEAAELSLEGLRAPDAAQETRTAADAAPTEPGPPREVVIRFRGESENDVRLAGDFNGWVPDKGVRSTVESEGTSRVWKKVVVLPPGTYQYRYVVDGEWREDPNNPEAIEGPMGARNSILVVR